MKEERHYRKLKKNKHMVKGEEEMVFRGRNHVENHGRLHCFVYGVNQCPRKEYQHKGVQ
jgi:hypothetical protein